MKLLLGLDIGGTKTEAALVRYDGQSHNVLLRERIPTGRHLKYEEIVRNFKDLVVNVLEQGKLPLKDLSGIGLALPGAINPKTECMMNGNSTIFVGKNIGLDLAEALNYKGPVKSENDANCFAYAEAVVGAGKEYTKQYQTPFEEQVSLGIILGTGCGGGIMSYGKILRGASGGAGEIGHSELYHEGHACYCGRRGCAEQYLSGPALEAHFVTRLYSQIKERPTTKDIFDLYEKRDPIAIAVVKSYLQDLAKFLANLTNIFSPHYFVLGGGLSLQPVIKEYFKTHIPYNLFIPEYQPPVYQHQLGDSAGVIGAALLMK